MTEATGQTTNAPSRRFRPYPEYRDSGVEWLGGIPAHWEPARLWRLCSATSGATPAKENPAYWNGEVPWVSPKDMKRRVISTSEDLITQQALDQTGIKLIAPQVVLVVVRGMILAHSFPVAVTAAPVTINQDMKALRLIEGVDAFYFAWALDGLARGIIATVVEEAAHGTRVIRMDQWRSLVVPLPPYPEQRAIADFLDRETAKIDALVARKERLIELLQEKRTALITRAVTRGLDPNVPMKDSGVEWLGEIPEHWEVCRLRRVVSKFVDYRGKTPEKSVSGVPLVTARNIKNQSIDFSLSEEFIPEELYPRWMVRGRPERGDVVITTEAPLGETAQVVDTGIALAQRVILLKVEATKITNDYLKYHFAADSGRMELRTRATGSTALGIKASHLKSSLLAVPSMYEQDEISRTVRSESEEVDVLIAKVREAIGQLREFRTALISAAVTGKIDVRETVPR